MVDPGPLQPEESRRIGRSIPQLGPEERALFEITSAPGPAQPFVGRGREVASLARLLKAAPLVAVVGPPGVGKTALSLAFAREHAAGGALLFAAPRPGAAFSADAVASLLARAEEAKATVVLDGLEATTEERSTVLSSLTRGARASRWIVTARDLPPGPPPRVHLGPLAPSDARALALAVGAPESDLDWVAEASLGSPARVRHLAGADDAPPAELPEAAHPWLIRLAAVTAPVPPEIVRDDDERDALCAAAAEGLVTHAPAGLSLDPVVRAEVREQLPPLSSEDKRDLARRFEAAADDASWINAVDLWFQLGERDRVLALLAERGERLIDSPRVGDLWKVLRPVTWPDFARWRFRVAVATGVVAEVDADEVRGDDPALRCDRARLLILRGKNEEARQLADAILADLGPDDPPRLTFRAAMASTAASLNLRQGEPALDVLARIEPRNDLERVSVDVVRAKALGIAGREGEGIAVLEEIRPLALRLLPVLPHPELARLGGACIDLDQRALARHLLPDPVASAHSAFGPDVTHLVDVAHACIIALDDGRLADVAPFAELQETLPLADSLVSDHVRLIRAEWLVATGRFAEAERVIDAVGAVDRSDNVEWIAMLRAQIELATGVPPVAELAAGGEAASTDGIARMRQAIRWGRGPIAALPARMQEKPRTRRCMPLQLRAEHALFHGAVEDAAYDAERACREAERYGYRVLLADALLTRADVACVGRDWRGCREAAEQLVATGRAIASPRWEGEGAFYLAALDHDWAALERLAGSPEPAPAASRRAAALLGDGRALDHLDERVVSALRAHDGWPEVHVVGGDGDPWGIDLTAGRAWVDGAWVELETHKVTWRVLEAIAGAGGRADSRDLLREVWDVREYKPHLHDNRLQITVHRLRGALGGDGEVPRILREGEGYALAGRARLVRGQAR